MPAVLVVVFLAAIVTAGTLYDQYRDRPGNAAGSPIDTNSTRPETTPAPRDADFDAVSGHVSAAVVRITSVACDAGSEGSGFLIDSDTVVTAAHVVDEAAAVEVQSTEHAQEASVERIDTTADLAVLQLDQPLTTATLDFAGHDAATGDDVATVGYPDGNELQSLTEGAVDATDITAPVEGDARQHLAATTAEASPGNSGGPLVDADGAVVGVVVAREEHGRERSFAVQTSAAAPRINDHTRMPSPDPVHCDGVPLGPDDGGADDLPSEPDLSRGADGTLADYFSGINTGDYAQAYEQLSPAQQGRTPYDDFVEQVRSSYDHQFAFHDADIGPDHATVWLEFTSLQDPELGADGQSCSRWSLDYDLTRGADGSYRIDRVLDHGNSDGPEPCD